MAFDSFSFKFNDTDNNTSIYFHCSANVVKTYAVYGMYIKNWLLVGIVNLFLAPTAFVMNLMTLLALRKSKDRNTITNYVFTSLCTTDMMTGLIVQPLYGIFYLTVYRRNTFCGLLYTTIGFAYFFVAISFFALIAIHVERYLGICYPFYYKTIKMKTSLIKKIILGMWILTAIVVLLCFLTPNLMMYSVLAALLAPVAFIGSCYVQVKITGHVRRMAGLNRIGNSVSQTDDMRDGECESRYDRSVHRVNKIAGLILLAYTVCYIPNMITYIWHYFDRKSHMLLAITVWTETLVFLNSICNPLLFCLQKRDVWGIAVSSLRSMIGCSAAIHKSKQDCSSVITESDDKVYYCKSSKAMQKI